MRKELSIKQSDKIILISHWISKMAAVQIELQLLEKWHLLDKVRRINDGLAVYLIQIVSGTDNLDEPDWENLTFGGLIKDSELLAAYKASVLAGVHHDLNGLGT